MIKSGLICSTTGCLIFGIATFCTLLMTNGPLIMNRVLSLVESESAYFNLKSNHDKCHVICMNGNRRLQFQNGQRLENVDHSKYLGCILSKNACVSTEIGGRIAPAMDAISMPCFMEVSSTRIYCVR